MNCTCTPSLGQYNSYVPPRPPYPPDFPAIGQPCARGFFLDSRQTALRCAAVHKTTNIVGGCQFPSFMLPVTRPSGWGLCTFPKSPRIAVDVRICMLLTPQTVTQSLVFVDKRISTFVSLYNWTVIHHHYFRPAFFAAVRALLICFFQPKHWLQAMQIRGGV